MNEAQQKQAIEMRPLHGGGAERWQLQLEAEILTLATADGRIVMMLPREEAVKHLHFDWDVLHGRTLSLFMMEGLRAYRFVCGRECVRTLLTWLPRKSQSELDREVRRYGAVVVLLGALQLLFPSTFYWLWGLIFIGQGLLMSYFARRFMYGMNAVLMLGVGLACLFFPVAPAIATDQLQEARVFSTALGSLLLLWSIQQFSLLSPNQQLRDARRRRGETAAYYLPGKSRLITRISWSLAVLSVLLCCQVGGVLFDFFMEGVHYDRRDWLICLPLTAVALVALIVLRFGRRNPYFEARVAGQFMVVVTTICLAGLFHMELNIELWFSREIFWAGLFAMGRPYVWAPLVVFITLFNRWFTRAAETELAETQE